MNLSNERIKAALAGLAILAGTVTPLLMTSTAFASQATGQILAPLL